MPKKPKFHDHIDPEYQRWGKTYPSFPGIPECVDLILNRKAIGAWADIVAYELAENADEHADEMIGMFNIHQNDSVSLFMLMAFELAAIPSTVPFFASVLCDGDNRFKPHARRGLEAINTKESRTALFNAMTRKQ